MKVGQRSGTSVCLSLQLVLDQVVLPSGLSVSPALVSSSRPESQNFPSSASSERNFQDILCFSTDVSLRILPLLNYTATFFLSCASWMLSSHVPIKTCVSVANHTLSGLSVVLLMSVGSLSCFLTSPLVDQLFSGTETDVLPRVEQFRTTCPAVNKMDTRLLMTLGLLVCTESQCCL